MRTAHRRTRLTSTAALAVGVALAIACGGGTADRDTSDDDPGASTSTAGASSAAFRTLAADTNPCAWVSADEAARLVGRLSGTPWRARDAEQPDSDDHGHACVYPLAAPIAPSGADASDETRYYVAMELQTEDVTASEAGAGMFREKVAAGGGSSAEKDIMKEGLDLATRGGDVPPGWDAASWLPVSFVGRLGAVAVKVQSNGFFGARADSVARFAALVRDRLPDVPVAVPDEDRSEGGSDACTLLTRSEAEGVLGALTIPPYRSDANGRADPSGEQCSYYRGRHRVLTIVPTWENGKMLFRMSAGLSQGINSAVGAKGASADTLDGPWDQAGAGIGGSLFFLTGDRMLEVRYLTAGVDPPSALRLAALAVRRLQQR